MNTGLKFENKNYREMRSRMNVKSIMIIERIQEAQTIANVVESCGLMIC